MFKSWNWDLYEVSMALGARDPTANQWFLAKCGASGNAWGHNDWEVPYSAGTIFLKYGAGEKA